MFYIFYFCAGQSGAQEGGGTSGANARVGGAGFRASDASDNAAKANRNSKAAFFTVFSGN
jgi:hypothetical protein